MTACGSQSSRASVDYEMVVFVGDWVDVRREGWATARPDIVGCCHTGDPLLGCLCRRNWLAGMKTRDACCRSPRSASSCANSVVVRLVLRVGQRPSQQLRRPQWYRFLRAVYPHHVSIEPLRYNLVIWSLSRLNRARRRLRQHAKALRAPARSPYCWSSSGIVEPTRYVRFHLHSVRPPYWQLAIGEKLPLTTRRQGSTRRL